MGGSIQDQGDSAQENYISSQDAAWYARLFQEKGLKNGHVILLNSKDSAYYEQTRQQALSALQAYPGGLQVGGGITAENAREYLDAGASHVIVTSYVFRNGDISFENLNRMMDAVGKKRLVGSELPQERREVLYRDGSLANLYEGRAFGRNSDDAVFFL